MALTRPRLGQLISNVAVLADPITVLNGGATNANVDVGFLMNRANGLVSNVAIYWNETGQSFVTAFTSNSGATDNNISVTSYANLTTGTVNTDRVVTTTGVFWPNGSAYSSASASSTAANFPYIDMGLITDPVEFGPAIVDLGSLA